MLYFRLILNFITTWPYCRERNDLNGVDTRTLAESSYTTQLLVQDYNSATAQHKNRLSSAFDDRQGRDLFRVLKRPPICRPHALVFEVVPMGKQQAARPDSDEDCTYVGEFQCYSHYAERLARVKQVPLFKILVRPNFNFIYFNFVKIEQTICFLNFFYILAFIKLYNQLTKFNVRLYL